MTIVQQHSRNFETLREAFLNRDAALLECQLKTTGELVAVVVAVNQDADDFAFVPIAMMFNGNPYECLNPPKPEGGFDDGQ